MRGKHICVNDLRTNTCQLCGDEYYDLLADEGED